MFKRPYSFIFAFLLVLTFLRLCLVGLVELSPDEAYYQMWSERLDWSYYSKGPGVAFVIRAGTFLFGQNEFGVRFFSPLLALGTSLLLLWLAAQLYGRTVAVWTVLMLNLTPLFTAGSLLMTIDPLSIFFWTAAMCCVWKALQSSLWASTSWWILGGVSMALGILSKYTNAVELLSVLLTLLWVSRWRKKEFARPGVYLFFLISLLGFAPPIWWNSQHAWITVAHLRDRGSLNTGYAIHPTKIFQFFIGHFGVYSPLIFLGLMIALVWGLNKAFASKRSLLEQQHLGQWGEPFSESAMVSVEKIRFLLSFTLPLLTMYLALSLKTAGEPNWTAPSFLSLGILATMFWWAQILGHKRRDKHPTQYWVTVSYCVAAIGMAAVLSLVALNSDLIRYAGLPLPYRKDPTTRLRGWKSMGEAVGRAKLEVEAKLKAPVFLIANKYQTASELNFYLPKEAKQVQRAGDPAVYLPESQDIQSQFAFWPSYDLFESEVVSDMLPTTSEEESLQIGKNRFMGQNAFYISEGQQLWTLPDSIRNGFERCEPYKSFELKRCGQPLRTFYIFICYHYQTLPL